MKYSLNILLLFLCFLCGCKFKYSPYEVGYPELRSNEVNLAAIQRDENQFGTEYKIAFISDTHNYYEELDDLIKTINQRGPYSFVIVTGDLTNNGLLEEYQKTKEYLNDLNYPYLAIVGNHDLLSNGDRIFDKMFGKTNFNLVYKDLEFIFFNNNNWESPGVIPNIATVEDQLTVSISPFKILVAHVSPDDRDRFSKSEIENWERLVNSYRVDYFFNGHNHNPEEGSFATAKHITIGAPSKRTFFELIKDSNGLTHKEINY